MNAVEITGEAVVAAARVLGGDNPSVIQMDAARIALEAALPHLAPRPAVDREAVATALARQFCEEDPGTDYFDALSETEQAECVKAMGSFADAVLALLNRTAS